MASDAAGNASTAAAVEPRHFESALSQTFPSVSARDRRAYAGLKKKLGQAHRRVVAEAQDEDGSGAGAEGAEEKAGGEDGGGVA